MAILYNMKCLGQNWQALPKKIDFLLLACGSDFRAYELLKKCSINEVDINLIYMFNFKEREDSLQSENKKQYYEFLNFDYKYKIKTIDCSINDPSLCVKSFRKLEKNFSSKDIIAIDISVFTKPYIFTLLKYLNNQIGIPNIIVFYTEPMSYIFSRGLHLSYHSTSGPLKIKEVPGFPGNDIRATDKLLIVLLGFDGELSTFIYEEIAPNKVVAINGFPGYAPKYKDISMISNEKLLNNIKSEEHIKFVQANNPFATFNVLEKLKSKYQDAFFNIAPLGTKPMALGACLYALTDSTVRIVYPLPDKYKEKTTKDFWFSWVYFVPLRSC